MKIKYDIVIPVAEKDFNKLPYVIEGLYHIKNDFHNIICISPKKIPYSVPGIEVYLDEDIFHYKKPPIKTNWIKTMFIKLFQEVSLDNFLVVDADVIFLKPFSLYDKKPYCFYKNSDIHKPYENFSIEMLGMSHNPRSYILDFMLFDRNIINKMIPDKEKFYNKAMSILNENCYPSEYEMYGNFVVQNNLYEEKLIDYECNGKYGYWSNPEIEDYIANSKATIGTVHSWIET